MMQRAKDILEKIFEGREKNFNIRLWNGHLIEWANPAKFTLVFRNKAAFKKIVLRGDALTAGSAYIENDIDIEGDIFEAIKLADYLAALKLSGRDKINILARLITL